MLRITGGKGFQLTFDNGLTVSVQIGIGNYCNNNDNDYEKYMTTLAPLYETKSRDCEVAVVNDNEWVTHLFFPDHVVYGFLPVSDLPDLLTKVQNYKIGGK